jgi:glycosyltransferase involved in cell wall biosynthesis
MTGARPPRFSIVTAVYDVEPYLPEFISSIEAQHVDPGDLEVIAVDDGSLDGSLKLITDWARRSRFRVQVLTKPNGGQGSARNLGLEHATGEWVTFTDPDDMLDPDFLRVAEAFAGRHPDVQLMACKPILYLEATGLRRDIHPRRKQYGGGNRVADMDEEPDVFPGSSSVSFYRLDRLRTTGLRFDPQVQPNFEDGHFAAHYLFSLERPRVGLLADAHYIYRKRADQTSTLQRSLRDVRRYTSVLEHGYLDVVERARERYGAIPPWVQHLLVYELYWYLNEDRKISSGAYIEPAALPRFHELLRRLLVELDPEVVAAHGVHRLDPVLTDVFARAGRPGSWHSPFVVRTRVDRTMGLRRVQYRFTGDAPREETLVDGQPVEIAFAKTMTHRFYGRDLLFERILWIVHQPGVEVRLDGAPVPLLKRWPRHRHGRRRGRIERWVRRLLRARHRSASDIGRAINRRVRRLGRALRGRSLRLIAAQRPFSRRFAKAWLVMDRIHDADDNGERLFEHLRARRPDINAWFVIEPGTTDWRRLRARGERRLLAHGSFAWKMAMLNCDWLVSSHADLPVYRPHHLAGTGRAQWRFAFLQHGITKDDLSVWLNLRELDLFVVSTEAELASVVADGTAYRFTAREARNTGLPRFDRLLEKGRAVQPEDRDLVIVAPTWRQWLARSLISGALTQRRALEGAFWDSEYIRSWTAVLRSQRVADALAARGWRLGFMPHPNLQAMLPELDLPPHVEPLSFAGTDVQGLYARCALLVTDYSSVAFNTAYLDRPVVYFQFDRELMLGGAHIGREGYFDYHRDGFGPVVEDVESAEAAIVASIERGASPAPDYQRRIDVTFPVRDGGACARVVAAIEELSRPWRPAGQPDPEGAPTEKDA